MKTSKPRLDMAICGYVSSDVKLERIKDLISFDVQAMLGRSKSDSTKWITVTINIEEK